MLCEKCGKMDATTHIRSVVNGVVHEKHLCSHCAANDGYGDIKGNNLSQMLSSMFGDTMSTAKNWQLKRCSCCGSTYADIAESGKCGCSECYITFYEQLLPYLKKVQGSIEYVGKKIVRENNYKSIDELNNQLKELIKEENYEQAAIVRDKIKKLKEGAL